MKKRVFWAVAIAVTIWQVYAGIQRCGAIDGGVLIVPLVMAIVMMARGVFRDLRAVFGETGQRKGALWR